jgi:putative endonuclease
VAEKDERGRAGEERAVGYLERAGFSILDRNWRCSQGEIDIIAERAGALAFVEVKTRAGLGYGHPFEAITRRKLLRMHRLAMAWVIAHPDAARGRSIRLDAIAITGRDLATASIEHLEGLR